MSHSFSNFLFSFPKIFYSLYLPRLCLPVDVPADNVTGPGLLLQPVLPGLNLPASQLVHYLTSLTLASVYHEAGHAVAAYNCDIKVSPPLT